MFKISFSFKNMNNFASFNFVCQNYAYIFNQWERVLIKYLKRV